MASVENTPNNAMMVRHQPPPQAHMNTPINHSLSPQGEPLSDAPSSATLPPDRFRGSAAAADELYPSDLTPEKRSNYSKMESRFDDFPPPPGRKWEDRDREYYGTPSGRRPSGGAGRYLDYYADRDRASYPVSRSQSQRYPERERFNSRTDARRRSLDDEERMLYERDLPRRRRDSFDDDEMYDFLAWKDSKRRRPQRKRYQDDDDDDDDFKYGSGNDGNGNGRNRGNRKADDDSSSMRLPFTSWMGKKVKGHFVATMGEFVGTTMFLFFAFAGTQVANVGSRSNSSTTTNSETGFSPEVLAYIALSFGVSLTVNVWIFYRISGGMFNPAVTLGMCAVKAISVFRACILLVAQLAGSIFASFLVKVMFPTPLNVRTTLSTDTSLAQGVFIEAVLTAELIFTIFMLAKEKHKATFMAPLGIGLALFVAELVGVFYTGGSLNPARSFGPCVVTGVFDPEHWIYWVGPGVGAIIAVVFYKFILILQYELANPGQDEESEQKAAEKAEEVNQRKTDGLIINSSNT